jgi:hypothetical protein
VLNDLFTLNDYRRQSIGKTLIKHCEKFAPSKGAARLQWGTAPNNVAALALYKSLGANQSSWEFFTYTTQGLSFFGLIYPGNLSITWITENSHGYNHGRILGKDKIGACYVESWEEATAGCAELFRRVD